MEQQQINDIIEKYKQGIASPAELAQLNNWYRDNAYLDAEYPDSEQEVYDRIITRLNSTINPVQRKTKLWPRIAAAAAILLVAGAGLFFYTSYYAPRHLDNRRDLQNFANDIAPGKVGATLTLASGKKITLSDAKNGELAKEAGVTITKDANGQLVYAVSSSRGTEGSLDHATSRDLSYRRDDGKAGTTTNGAGTNSAGLTNTLTTAKGETYQVRLPDGTLIWLNAASTLKYPASFTAHKNRRVELSGEGYFEVAKDKAHPFIVATDKQEVEVLGTHFNINSYADETATKTTLLEGSVRVVSTSRHLDPSPSSRQSVATRDLLNSTDKRSLPAGRDDVKGGDDVTLKPNQQATLVGNNRITVKQVDAELAIAWKNGIFDFKNTPLETIMKQVSRWYNVEIVYEDAAVKTETISGAVSRYDKVSRVLKALEFTGGVKFTISGQKIIVQSNK